MSTYEIFSYVGKSPSAGSYFEIVGKDVLKENPNWEFITLCTLFDKFLGERDGMIVRERGTLKFLFATYVGAFQVSLRTVACALGRDYRECEQEFEKQSFREYFGHSARKRRKKHKNKNENENENEKNEQ